MFLNTLSDIKDLLHAQLCYQLWITPMYLPLSEPYRNFARQACDYVQQARSELLEFEAPRQYVIHRFAQPNIPHARKILITHGWMSRAAYMTKFIQALHQQGFDVYALDFPAHGDSKGIQLEWTEAVLILRKILNTLGPFYGVMGHSFGGSMLLNVLNLSCQSTDWRITIEPQRVIMLASPTRMRTPFARMARQLKLSAKGYLLFKQQLREQTFMDYKLLNFRHYISHSTIPFLCIHGEEDSSVDPSESIVFCQQYLHASLNLVPGVDHVNILMDERVATAVCNFFK